MYGCKRFSCECWETRPGEDAEFSVVTVTGTPSFGHSGFDEKAKAKCEDMEIHYDYPHAKVCQLGK